MHHAYKTTIGDGVSEVVGRGPTPEASHEAPAGGVELEQLFEYRQHRRTPEIEAADASAVIGLPSSWAAIQSVLACR